MDLLRLVLARQRWDDLARLPALASNLEFYRIRKLVWQNSGKHFDQSGEPYVGSKIPGILLTIRAVFLRDVPLFQRLRHSGADLDFWTCLASGIPEFQAEALAHWTRRDLRKTPDISFIPWTPQLMDQVLKLYTNEHDKWDSNLYHSLLKLHNGDDKPESRITTVVDFKVNGRNEIWRSAIYDAKKEDIDAFPEDVALRMDPISPGFLRSTINIAFVKRVHSILSDSETMKKIPYHLKYYYRAVCGEVYDSDDFLDSAYYLRVGIPFEKPSTFPPAVFGSDQTKKGLKDSALLDLVFYSPRDFEFERTFSPYKFWLAAAAYRLGYCFETLPLDEPLSDEI